MKSIINNAIIIANCSAIASGDVTIVNNKVIYGTANRIDMIDTVIENDNGSIELRRRFDDDTMHIYSFSNEYDAAAWLLGYEQFKDCAHLF